MFSFHFNKLLFRTEYLYDQTEHIVYYLSKYNTLQYK